jgi:hypothetical protein
MNILYRNTLLDHSSRMMLHRRNPYFWTHLLLLVSGILISLTSSAFTSTEKKGNFQQSQRFQKTISLNSRQKVALHNSYGSIVIKTWDQPSVQVQIEIKSSAKKESVAKEAIDRVHIQETVTSELVKFETVISRPSTGLFQNNSDERLEIHYVVHLPSKQALKIDMRYGHVTMPVYLGPTELNVDYGQLSAGDLPNRLDLVSNYSSIKLGQLGDAKMKVRYGNLRMNGSQKLTLQSDYSSPVQVGEVEQEAYIKIAYCSGVQLGFGAQLQNATIDARYSHVDMVANKQSSFEFAASQRYGSYSIQNGLLKNVSQSNSNTSSAIKGMVGDSNNRKVALSIWYGNFKLNTK